MNEKKLGAYFAGPIEVGGDFVGGDSIKIGNISDSSNVAIGRGSSTKPKRKERTMLQRFLEIIPGADMLIVCPDDLVSEMSGDILEVASSGTKYVMIAPAVWERVEGYIQKIVVPGRPTMYRFNRETFSVSTDPDWAFTILSIVMEQEALAEEEKPDPRVGGASISITLE